MFLKRMTRIMESCLFCKIIKGEIPSSKVYEDEAVFAFNDINPQAPTHILVIPKAHVSSVAKVLEAEQIGQVLIKAADIAREAGLEEKGYRLVSNHGADAGQTVFHLHVHILGGRPMAWPPG
jgi:histidine triad (HIT) family protein